jgi:tetratricopeptide (TPR) repeat protein
MALSESLAHYTQALLYNAIDSTNSIRTSSELCKTLQNAPDNHKLYTKIAAIAIHRKNPALAIDALNRSYNHNRKSYRRSYDLATAYQITGNYDAAITQLHKTIKLNKSDPASYITLARLYFELNQPKSAFSTIRHAVKSADNQQLIRVFLYEQGKAFISQNNPDLAIKCFYQLAKLDKEKQPYIFQLIAEIFINKNDPVRAENVLSKSTELDNSIPENYVTLAAIQQLNNHQTAIKTLKTALRKFPANDNLLFAAGRIYCDQGDFSEALKLFESASHYASINNTLKHPNLLSPEFYLYYGKACERTGNITKAEKIFEEALSKYHNHHQILNYLAYMWAQSGTNLNKALQYSKRSLKLKPNNPAYLDTLAWIYFKQQKYQTALAVIKKANKIIPNNPEILRHMANIYNAAGNEKDAISCWKLSYISENNPIVAHKLVSHGINIELFHHSPQN